MTLKFETQVSRSNVMHRRHGQPHRIDGPAWWWYDGDIRWLQYDKYHRVDNPAYCLGGTARYYHRGIQYDPTIPNNHSL
jgi:hypothetical protein